MKSRNDESWVKLYRSIRSHWVWKDPHYLRAWLYLLINARWSDGHDLWRGSLYECNRGELVVSVRALADELEMSRSKTVRFLHMLVETGMIEYESKGKVSHITICNYGLYQGERANVEPTAGQRKDVGGTKTGQSRDMERTSEGQSLNLKKERTKEQETIDDDVGPGTNDSSDFCDFYISAFNAAVLGKSIRQISSLGKERQRKLRALEDSFDRETILLAFRKAAESAFLNGGNDKGWTASFDWIIDGEHFSKVLEGNYSEAFAARQKSAVSSQQVRERCAAEEREREMEERKRQWAEEERQRNSPEQIAFLYKRFGGEELKQRAIEAGLNVEELDRERDVQSKKKR